MVLGVWGGGGESKVGIGGCGGVGKEVVMSQSSGRGVYRIPLAESATYE
jgi:hypothetical protein